MSLVSSTFDGISRKNETSILSGLAHSGQVHVAEALGVSESSISRMKDGQILHMARFLTACGMKVVPIAEVTICPVQLAAVETLFRQAVARTGIAELLTKVD